ncbi:flagellar basal body rod protein FlgG, partial [Escherichia coli]|nr:flagellar basal body rod protein FlgG [Escherichia coli]
GYTRAGNFSRSAEGQLVTAEGYQVMPGVTIPEGAISVTVGSDGTVSAQMPNQTDLTQIGQIQVASFPNPAGLQAVG